MDCKTIKKKLHFDVFKLQSNKKKLHFDIFKLQYFNKKLQYDLQVDQQSFNKKVLKITIKYRIFFKIIIFLEEGDVLL